MAAAAMTSAADTAQLLSLFLASPPGWQTVDKAAAQGIDQFVPTTPGERGVDVIARARRGRPDAQAFYFVVSLPELGLGFDSLYMIGFRDRGEAAPGGTSLVGLLPGEVMPRVAGVLTDWVTVQDFLDVINDPEGTLAVQARLQRQLALVA